MVLQFGFNFEEILAGGQVVWGGAEPPQDKLGGVWGSEPPQFRGVRVFRSFVKLESVKKTI